MLPGKQKTELDRLIFESAQHMSHPWTAKDFDCWLELQDAIGLKPTNPGEIARIRAILKSGGSMTIPQQNV